MSDQPQVPRYRGPVHVFHAETQGHGGFSSIDGEWVKASDYDLLLTRVQQLEGERDASAKALAAIRGKFEGTRLEYRGEWYGLTQALMAYGVPQSLANDLARVIDCAYEESKTSPEGA